MDMTRKREVHTCVNKLIGKLLPAVDNEASDDSIFACEMRNKVMVTDADNRLAVCLCVGNFIENPVCGLCCEAACRLGKVLALFRYVGAVFARIHNDKSVAVGTNGI